MSSTSQKDLNKTWENLFSTGALSEWQVSQIRQLTSEPGIRCLLKMWMNYGYDEAIQDTMCNATWDNVYCWPPIPSGTVDLRLCSDILHEMYPKHSAQLEGKAKRSCISEEMQGAESQTDYSECVESYAIYLKRTKEDRILIPMVQYMLFFGSIASLICLLASLGIFNYFRCLWCDRVTVHVHLMVSLVFRFLVMFIISEPYILGLTNDFRDADIICESILVVFLYATFTSVSWMFIQGLYLNVTLLTRNVSGRNRYHLWVYCMIGWVVPAVFVLVYVIVMMVKEQNKCWEGYADMDEIWILLGPIMFEVVVNGFFLLNVLRILLKKVRNSNSRPDSSQIKAAAKATAFLFPVLGINNLILLHNPGGEYNKYFVTLNTFFGSTQGIFVAIVYCFIDKEVHAAIRRYWDRINATRNLNQTLANQRQVNVDRAIRVGNNDAHRQNVEALSICMEHSV